MLSIRSARMFIRFNAPCSEIGLPTNQNYSYSANGDCQFFLLLFAFISKEKQYFPSLKVFLDNCQYAGKRFEAHLLANNEDIRLTGEGQCDKLGVMYHKFKHYWTLTLTFVLFTMCCTSPNLLTSDDFISWPMSRHFSFSQAEIYQQYHGMLGMQLSWIIYLITFRDFFQGRCVPTQQL